MKRIEVILVGAGNRGKTYTEYAIRFPKEMKVIGVVEPQKRLREEFAARHNIPTDMQFLSVEELVRSGKTCDIVFNCTLDNLHYQTCKVLLQNKYNILVEKPITPKKEELLELVEIAQKNACFVAVCHVLRYTPFYQSIKRHIINGEIGKITSIYMSECVKVGHFVESYVAGKWKSEQECGSPFLLAKSCHDTDLMCWLNNDTEPEQIASFGDRRIFLPENSPVMHGERCTSCSAEPTCKYSILKALFKAGWTARIMNDIDKPHDQITKEDIIEHLKVSDYGKCAYTNRDLMDRQNFIIKFKNGSIGTFDLIGAAATGNRHLHIVGEDGEIFGDHSKSTYCVRKFNFDTYQSSDQWYDVGKDIKSDHGGGDDGLIRELIAYLNGDRSSISITKLSDSVNGHLVVYNAEISRKTGQIVRF